MEPATIAQKTVRRLQGRMRRLSIPDTAAIGLGVVMALLFCGVILAGIGTHAARTAADGMKTRCLPFMEAALTLERTASEAVYRASMFGSSGAMENYSASRILFADLREVMGRLAYQALNVSGGTALPRDLEMLRELVLQLDMAVEKKRTLNDELAAEQVTLQKIANEMGEILLDLQARVAAATSNAKPARENDAVLDEKARLLVLNGFSLAVAEVTGRVLAAGVAKNAEDMAKAQDYFNVRWAEAREACVAAAALAVTGGAGPMRVAENPAGNMDTLVGQYTDSLRNVRFNLEESARVTADREAIASRLTEMTRKIVAFAREGIDEAADSTDAALRGAAATIFACALLAAILAVGAAFAFIRSRRQGRAIE